MVNALAGLVKWDLRVTGLAFEAFWRDYCLPHLSHNDGATVFSEVVSEALELVSTITDLCSSLAQAYHEFGMPGFLAPWVQVLHLATIVQERVVELDGGNPVMRALDLVNLRLPAVINSLGRVVVLPHVSLGHNGLIVWEWGGGRSLIGRCDSLRP
jgi:hypothetical protein